VPTVPTVDAPSVRATAAPADNAIVNALAGAAAQFQKDKADADTSRAEEALVNFEREKNTLLFDPTTGYYNTQGKTAMDGAEDIDLQIQKMAKGYGKDLSPEGQKMFNRAAMARITKDQLGIMRHASKGKQAWDAANYDAERQNALENAALNFNSTDILRDQLASGKAAVVDYNRTLGITGERPLAEAIQTFESNFNTVAIKAAITQKDFARADELLNGTDKTDGVFLEGDDKAELTAKLKEGTDKAKALVAIDALAGTGASLSEQLKEAGKIKDKEIKAKVLRGVNDRWVMDKRATEADQEATFEGLATQVEAGTSPDQLDSEERASLKSGHRTQLDALWKGKVEGKEIPDNDIGRHNFNKATPAELKDMTPADARTKYFGGKTSTADGKAIAKRLKEVSDGVSSPAEKASKSIDAMATDLTNTLFGSTGPKKGSKVWPEYDALRTSMVKAFLAEERALLDRKRAGGDESPVMTADEAETIRGGLATKVVKEGWIWDTNVYLNKVMEPEEIQKVVERMRAKGVRITSTRIWEAHQAAQKKSEK